jgi:hypothetical protein
VITLLYTPKLDSATSLVPLNAVMCDICVTPCVCRCLRMTDGPDNAPSADKCPRQTRVDPKLPRLRTITRNDDGGAAGSAKEICQCPRSRYAVSPDIRLVRGPLNLFVPTPTAISSCIMLPGRHVRSQRVEDAAASPLDFDSSEGDDGSYYT